MAGESPDKSEQRKSSGTAPEERDPRLAVLREPVASASSGSGTDGTGGAGRTGAAADTGTGTDTATAVFRSPSAEELGEERAGAGSDAVGEGAAVVDTDEPEPGADGSDRPEGSGSEPRPERGAEPGGAVKGPGGGSTAREDGMSTESAADAHGATGAAEAAGAGEADEADEAAVPEARAESGRIESGDRTEPVESGAEPERPESADRAEPAEGGAEPESGAGAELVSGAEPASAAAPEREPVTPDAPSDARLRAAVSAWVSSADDPDPDTAGAAGPDDGDTPAAATDSGKADTSAASHADAADETADERPGTDAVPDVPHVPKTRDSRTTAAAGPRDAGSGSAGSTGSTGKGAPPANAEPAADKRGIDHPTAVFKAPRPPRVDQPTTALKLPPKAPKPEAPAERTSKFVPLRSDDVRPAAVVGPTVTPAITPKPGYNPGRPSTTSPTGTSETAGSTGTSETAGSTGTAGPAGTTGTPGTTGPVWNATPAAPEFSAPRFTAPGLTEAERTRQQPMPPKPPLDLLAELTNTPPPRQTPVRTVVRRVKIWTPLLLLVVIIFAIAQAVRPLPEPVLVLSADPTYTFGGGNLEMPWPAEGQGAVEVEGVGTIGTYGKEKSAPIASVAKVMTAYVILKEHPITGEQTGERIVVDKKAGEEADRPDESTAPIEEGQKYTERQMLQLLMIPSGNNVARLLARWDATTEDAFVEKMNAAAKDLGMTKSTYTDPSGLKSTTVSTPADQLKLAKAVMQNDVFRKIVNMPQADIPGIGKTIYNNNDILLEPGVSGIKTGSSTPAGGNLLWAADTVIDGKSRRIIGAVMGADTDGTLNDKLERARQNSLKLIQAAQEGVDSAVVVKKGQVVGYVDDGLGGRTPVVSTKDLKAIGWGGLQVKLDIDEGAQAPAHAAKPGTVVGSVTVGTGTGRVTAPVALQSEMTEPTFGEKLTRIG